MQQRKWIIFVNATEKKNYFCKCNREKELTTDPEAHGFKAFQMLLIKIDKPL